MCLRSFALALGCIATATSAQIGHTPASGTAERHRILDALRPSVEAKFGPSVEFVVKDITAYGGWALVIAQPQRKGGGEVNWRGYMTRDEYNLGGVEISAVLRFQNGRWNLIDSQVGATDVWYCNLGPREIHPYC